MVMLNGSLKKLQSIPDVTNIRRSFIDFFKTIYIRLTFNLNNLYFNYWLYLYSIIKIPSLDRMALQMQIIAFIFYCLLTNNILQNWYLWDVISVENIFFYV